MTRHSTVAIVTPTDRPKSSGTHESVLYIRIHNSNQISNKKKPTREFRMLPKSVRNCCVIEGFGGVCVLSRCFFDFSDDVGAFVIGLSQISSFFS